jgi:ankyrin repeat protein
MCVCVCVCVCVSVYIEHKASLEARDQAGNTSLHWAAATGKRDVIKCMLELRPDLVDQRGEMGET